MSMQSTYSKSVSANIKAEMARRSVTQSALATKINKNQQWVQRRLSGATDIKVSDVMLIAEAIDVPLTELIAGRSA